MLDLEYILKVGRLLDDTGTPRPGFIDDDADNFEGPEIPSQPSSSFAIGNSDSASAGRKIVVSIESVVDETNGDVRLVRRRKD